MNEKIKLLLLLLHAFMPLLFMFIVGWVLKNVY
jgi:hypothetical protein